MFCAEACECQVNSLDSMSLIVVFQEEGATSTDVMWMALTAVPFPLLHTTAYVFSYYICPQSSRALPLIFPKEDINILSLRAVSTARLLRKKNESLLRAWITSKYVRVLFY